jgi:hypothetical protein
MAIDANKYPVFYAAVMLDSSNAWGTFSGSFDPNTPPPAFVQQAFDVYNRDQMLLGTDVIAVGGFYVTNSTFALLGLPPISLPAGTPFPPLSADLLTQLLVGGVSPSGAALTTAPVQAYVPPAAPTPTPTPTAPAAPVVTTAPAAPVVTTSPVVSKPDTPAVTLKPLGQFADDPISYCELYPLDPLCEYFLGGAGNGAVTQAPGVAGQILETVTIVEQGLSATDVDGIVTNAMGGLWGAVVGAVDLVLAQAIAQIQNVITDIGNALKAAYAILARLAGFILNFLQWLWEQIVKGILAVLQDLRNLLADLYKNVLVPLVNGLANIRQYLFYVYQRFIRPMLIVIQDIRRVLTILAAFHIAFAQKLDAKLANLERRISQPLFYLLSFTNGVANFINLIVTARYLFQKPLFLNSFNAYIGESLNLQLNAMSPLTTPGGSTAAAAANALPTVAQSEADSKTYLTTGGGDYATLIEQQGVQLQAYLAESV